MIINIDFFNFATCLKVFRTKQNTFSSFHLSHQLTYNVNSYEFKSSLTFTFIAAFLEFDKIFKLGKAIICVYIKYQCFTVIQVNAYFALKNPLKSILIGCRTLYQQVICRTFSQIRQIPLEKALKNQIRDLISNTNQQSDINRIRGSRKFSGGRGPKDYCVCQERSEIYLR